MYRDENRTTVSFVRGTASVAVPIDTQFGKLHFYIGQSLLAVPEGSGYRLQTEEYWYRLQLGPSLAEKAVVRWEYAKHGPQDGCRHHVQIGATVPLGAGDLDLDRSHLACGWVTIEEVLRFLIVDCGLKPHCGDAWSDVLAKGERKFFEEFTSKRHRAPIPKPDLSKVAPRRRST